MSISFISLKYLVNGGWSSWFGWSECSKSCDGGNRSRVRFCDNPHPEPDGQVCVGSDTGVGNCNEDSCPGITYSTFNMVLYMINQFCLSLFIL